MDDAPAHRAKEQLTEEEEAADVEQDEGQDGDSEGAEGQAQDDTQLLACDLQLGTQQRDVRLEHAHQGSARAAEGLAHARRCRLFVRLGIGSGCG